MNKVVGSVIKDTTRDLEKHFAFINPKTYLQCSLCGLRKIPEKFKEQIDEHEQLEISSALQSMFYGSKSVSNVCNMCVTSIMKKKNLLF